MDKKRLGRCYELAGSYVMEHPDTYLVHGVVEGMGRPPNPHAWVEVYGRIATGSPFITHIWEPVTDREYEPWLFNQLFNTQMYNRWSREAALQMMVQTGHYGPWR